MAIFLAYLIAALLFLALCGYFTLAKGVFGEARSSLLQKRFEEEKDSRIQRALALLEDEERNSGTCLVGGVGCGTLAMTAALLGFAPALEAAFLNVNARWLDVVAHPLSVVLVALVAGCLLAALGVLAPRKLASTSAEQRAVRMARVFSALRALMFPAYAVANALSIVTAKIMGVSDKEEEGESEEEELKIMVADSEELLDDEKRMIHEILDLGDMMVREIMQPRVDMIAVEDTETVRTALDRMRGTGYSRLPVYHEELDQVTGIVYYKDLATCVADGQGDDLVTKHSYETLFVPETKKVYSLLSELQEGHQQLAIVVDEYGGVDGLITVEDILEEIVGEIIDESDVEGKQLVAIDDSTWTVDGRFPVEEAAKLGWPVTDSDDYETIAGWLMGIIDVVPSAGDRFDIGDYQFMVQKMRRSRISTLRVQRRRELEGESQTSASE